MSIQIKDVSKRFGSFVALDGINLHVPDGSLLALLGPSGSGKTTLLRIIAGLELADEGSVLYQDEDITNHSARDRKVGFVFQHYALFRHMTIEDNIGFGLRVRGAKKPEIRERVHELLKLIRLDGLGRRYPGQLSGGQRQRVALARALAARPKVLLLDEPFGALDARVRQELRLWLRRLHEEIHVTSIFVTHDQEEAFEVADHVVVMNNGQVEQVGTPEEVFETPATPFVMSFLGNVNVFHGRVESGRALLGSLTVEYPEHLEAAPLPAAGYARPHELELERSAANGGGYWAMLTDINAAAAVVRLELEGPDGTVQVALSRERYEALLPRRGESLYVRPRRVRVFLENGNGQTRAGLDSALANGQTSPPHRERAVTGGPAAS